MNELLSYRFTSEIDFQDRTENSNIFNVFKFLETVEVSVALCYYYYKNEKSIDFFFLRFRSQLSKVNGITSSARHPIPGHSISYRFQLYTYSSARSGKSRQGAARKPYFHASKTTSGPGCVIKMIPAQPMLSRLYLLSSSLFETVARVRVRRKSSRNILPY